MYIHKLNFDLNQTTNIITLSLSHLYNNSYHTYTNSHTKTLDSLFPEDSCIELDSEVCTCYTPLHYESTQPPNQ